MKIVAQILMGLAFLALIGIVAGAVYAFVHFGVNTKTIIAAFVGLLALGGIIGRTIVVFRDSLNQK